MTDRPTITPDPDRDGVILHLPEITHLDTQVWAADVGLTTEGLAALRTALESAAPAPAAPADQAALRDRIAEALCTTPREGYDATPAHRTHRYDARCALCAGEADTLADAVLAVLPPPADRAAALAEDLRYVLNYRGPGHDHERPGFWDTSGDPCTHCARLAVARRNLADHDAEPRRMADETPAAETDTLPAWLYQRFMPDGTGWDSLDDGQRSYWEHQAHAVRRAVARGGFKQPAAGTQTTALDVLRCLADPEACRWEGVYCVTHSWKSDIGRCPHGQAQALINGGTVIGVLPRRGDALEQWLKARRDEHRDTGRGVWTTLDNLLDRYRLHADTGTPLDEHVCEGQAVGDCECLEQPAVSPPPA